MPGVTAAESRPDSAGDPGDWAACVGPRYRDIALAVLRRAVELGVNHIDTPQYYGPDVANELIRSAWRRTPRTWCW